MFLLPKQILHSLLFIILLIGLFSLSTRSVHAGYAMPDFDKLNQEIAESEKPTTDKSVVVNSTAVNSMVLHQSVFNTTRMMGCLENCTEQAANKTAFGAISRLIGTMYSNPPASFDYYASNILVNAGLIKPAYAQGIGFTALNSLLPLWRGSLNVAYTIIAAIMVAIGFMIIFRRKIDPKTVISVQAALPKIIVTLLLITFSYAIVGFLIDLMYLVSALLIHLIAGNMSENMRNSIPSLQEQYLTGGLLTLMGSVFSGMSAIPAILGGLIIPLVVGGVAIGTVTAGPLGTIGGLLLGGLGLPGIIVFIVFLGLLFTFIRIALLLLNSYIQLLISLVLAPILLLQEAIPGKSAFRGWLLNVISNLSVFPATIALLLFGWGLTTLNFFYTSIPTVSPAIWSPPLLGILTTDQKFFPTFLGLGVFFLTPNLVVSIKKIFQPKPTLPITAGTMLSPLTGAVGTGMGAMSQFYYMQQVMNTGAFAGFLKKITGKDK